MPSLKSAAFPSAAQAALLFVALFLCEFVIGAALRDANGWLELNTMQIGVLAAVLGNGCVFAVVMHVQKLTYRELFHQSPASARAMLMLVVPPVLLLVPALLLTITSALNLLMRVVPLSAWEESMFSRMADGSIAAVLAVCVLAPLLEEMLFRGIVLRGFLQRYPRGQAIFMSALFFGAAHMNIYQFVVGFVMGTVLAWLYERTRLAHSVHCAARRLQHHHLAAGRLAGCCIALAPALGRAAGTGGSRVRRAGLAGDAGAPRGAGHFGLNVL